MYSRGLKFQEMVHHENCTNILFQRLSWRKTLSRIIKTKKKKGRECSVFSHAETLVVEKA